jgi:hypothetical protein
MECQCSTGVGKGLKDPAMMVFVPEEAKANCEEKTKTHKIKLVSSGLRDDNNSNNVLLRKLRLTPHLRSLTTQTRVKMPKSETKTAQTTGASEVGHRVSGNALKKQ